MNLYLLSQSVYTGWDTYDSAVVCANSEDDARKIHPNGETEGWFDSLCCYEEWGTPEEVEVKLIGTAIDGMEGVICASYNAG